MIQEEKDLVLKDLCARLPYGVKVRFYDHLVEEYEIIPLTAKLLEYTVQIGEIPPYLFPLSSMTDKQRKELDDTLVNLNLKALSDEINSEVIATYEVDFYNKNHFDYRGLIPKGLALDATGLGIYE